MVSREVPISTRRYEAYSHEALKAEVETDNDPSAVGEIGFEWAELAGQFADHAEVIKTAAQSSEQSWQGAGGDAMRASVLSMAAWSHQAAEASVNMANSMAKHSAIAARAKHDMPEPVEYDPAGLIRSTVQSGNIFALCALPGVLWANRAASEAAKQKAVDVMNARDAGFHTAVVTEGFPQPRQGS